MSVICGSLWADGAAYIKVSILNSVCSQRTFSPETDNIRKPRHPLWCDTSVPVIIIVYFDKPRGVEVSKSKDMVKIHLNASHSFSDLYLEPVRSRHHICLQGRASSSKTFLLTAKLLYSIWFRSTFRVNKLG